MNYIVILCALFITLSNTLNSSENWINNSENWNLQINNKSDQEITVYYQNGLTRYSILPAFESKHFTLSHLPQRITIHFNKPNIQQHIILQNTNTPLIISQINTIKLLQNKVQISKTIVFDPSKPSISVYEAD